MNKYITSLLILCMSNQAYAGKYDEALSNIKRNLNENSKMYEEKFKKSHETRISEFYYRRSLSRQVIAQEMIEDSYLNYDILMDVIRSYESSNSDLEELYYSTKNSIEFAEQNQSYAQLASEKLKLMKDSLELECEESNLSIVANRYDPLVSYPIPTIVRDEQGRPNYNVSFQMNFRYAYDDGAGNSSSSVDASVDHGGGVGAAVGFGVAGLACGVGAVVSGGAAATVFCNPGVIAAVAGVVASLFTGFTDQKEWEEFQDELDKEYAKANEQIKEIHRRLHDENMTITKSLCDKIDLETARLEMDSSISMIIGFLGEIEKIESSLKDKSIALKRTLNKDDLILEAMFITKRAKFLEMVQETEAPLRMAYAKEGVELMRFYNYELSPFSRKVKRSEGLKKLHHQKELMSLIAKGDILFGDYSVWMALKRSLK